MSKSNPALILAKKVFECAQDVRLNHEMIKIIARKWAEEDIAVPPWPKEQHLQAQDERVMLDYLFLLDALNFCFWAPAGKEKWSIEYEGKQWSGYFALALALKQFFEKQPEQATLSYFARISQRDFQRILEGHGELLLRGERWEIARAVSRVILQEYEGDTRNFIRSSQRKCSLLVLKIARELPSFNDPFLKRAQILAADIWGALDGQGFGYFYDMGWLTCFADYKLPQILHHLAILEYSAAFLEKIEKKSLIYPGSRLELEIRSATICAVEYLKEALRHLGKNFLSLQIDWILWNESQKIHMKYPHHRTKTVYY